MKQSNFFTLHANAVPGDLITLEQRFTSLAHRVQQLEQERTELLERNAALEMRVTRLEERNAELTAIPSGAQAKSKAAPAKALSRVAACSSDESALSLPMLASFGENSGVLGNHRLKREEIATVRFLRTLADAPKSAWDVSLLKDRSVLAWADAEVNGQFTLFIAGEGGVMANYNTSYLFSDFCNLAKIHFDQNFSTRQTNSMNSLFSGCNSLESLDLSSFQTENVTDMGRMFSGCHSLKTLDLSSFNTALVGDMCYMFYDCRSLTSIDLVPFITANVTDVSRMFGRCHNLTYANLSRFDTTAVNNMRYMFYDCRSLVSIDLSHFNLAQVTDMSGMFSYCRNLTYVHLPNLDQNHSVDTRWIFYNCISLAQSTRAQLKSQGFSA